MSKHRCSVVILGVIAAVLVSGCGRQTPAGAPRPILLGTASTNALADDGANPAAPGFEEGVIPEGGDAFLGEDAGLGGLEPVDLTLPDADASDVVTSEDIASNSVATGTVATSTQPTEAEAKRLADEAAAAEAARKQAEEAARVKAEAEAKAKAEAEAREAAERLATLSPKYVRAIGEGGLHSAAGISIAAEKVGETDVEHLYVVDNARNGLLGKYAAVRKYDLASGEYTNQSFEDIALGGARNLPTTVNRVKLINTKVVAADETTSWTFDAGTNLLESKPGTFELPTEVKLPNSEHRYKIAGGKLQRVGTDGAVVVTFGDDHVSNPVALALDKGGNLYVSGMHRSDKGSEKPAVVVFKAPQK